MTTTAEATAAAMLAAGGAPITAHKLAKLLLAWPDVPVVVAVDGPDPDIASPVDWVDVMGYWPASPCHGSVLDWDREDEPGADDPDPDVVKVVVIGQRGLPDEFRPERAP